MKKEIRLLTFLLMAFSFVACQKDDIDYSFLHQSYQGTITFADGNEFHVNSIYFKERNEYSIRITIPVDAIGNEEDKYKYIKGVSGRFEYIRNGNNRVLITLKEDARLDLGNIVDTKSVETNRLEYYFPTKYELIFDRKNDKVSDKISSLESNTGIKITTK